MLHGAAAFVRDAVTPKSMGSREATIGNASNAERTARNRIGATILLWLFIAPSSASAEVVIRVHRASQMLSVFVDGAPYATWRVSTARRGYRTPVGAFRPSRLERIWYSSKYDDAPMPNSIFFAGGYAIHGTTEIRNLGRPVSHGCIRLHPAHARELFDLVRSHGRRATRIVISSRDHFPNCRAGKGTEMFAKA